MMKRKASFSPGLSLAICIFISACQFSKDNQKKISDIATDTTWAILPFIKIDSVNPVLTAGSHSFVCPILKKSVRWEEKDVFNPAAVVRGDSVYLLYRAEDKTGKFSGTSRLGLARSADGLHFSKRAEPVFFPDNDSMKRYEWEGGVEDPRLVETESGIYLMTYTAYDGKTARLSIASSQDLIHWTKHGPVLNGKYRDTWTKSGAIVASRRGSKIIAQKIQGKYWMYFGDTDLFMATSRDLLHWQPVEEAGTLKSVLQPRKNYFDSRLVESGPFALMNESGIILIYNGMNDDDFGDETYAKGAYCAGQALFDKNDPTRLLHQLEHPFMKPDKAYEISGQVSQVCFLEGLAPFRKKWFLYYGTADSRIAVATAPLL